MNYLFNITFIISGMSNLGVSIKEEMTDVSDSKCKFYGFEWFI